MEDNDINKKMKREKIIVISVLAIILIAILIFVGVKLKIFSGLVVQNPDTEEFSYYTYKQICSKDDSYFEELAGLVGGGSKKVREIKAQSIFCQTGEKQEITKEQLEDMTCECLEREIKKCQEGWQLTGDLCYKGSDWTSILKKCSFYKCEGNYYVEVKRKE